MYKWTEERIEMLKKLWQVGVSTSNIAKKIGTTKNSVIAKAHRLKLGKHPTIRNKKITKTRALRKLRRKSPRKRWKPDKLVRKVEPQAPVDKMNPCQVKDLTNNTCRYGYGDPKVNGFHFCGAPTCERGFGMYCAEHAELCYMGFGRRDKRTKVRKAARR